MNRSKLYEWLLDNDCPFEWEVDDVWDSNKSVKLNFWEQNDSFMQNDQSALDSFMKDKAIQDLEDAGIYPVPDNDAILENLYEESFEELSKSNPDFSEDTLKDMATRMAQIKFDYLPEPGDYDD